MPTLPLSTTDLDPVSLGLNESISELLIKTYLLDANAVRAGWLYEHLTVPIATTFQKGDIADNHNCTNLYNAL